MFLLTAGEVCNQRCEKVYLLSGEVALLSWLRRTLLEHRGRACLLTDLIPNAALRVGKVAHGAGDVPSSPREFVLVKRDLSFEREKTNTRLASTASGAGKMEIPKPAAT